MTQEQIPVDVKKELLDTKGKPVHTHCRAMAEKYPKFFVTRFSAEYYFRAFSGTKKGSRKKKMVKVGVVPATSPVPITIDGISIEVAGNKIEIDGRTFAW